MLKRPFIAGSVIVAIFMGMWIGERYGLLEPSHKAAPVASAPPAASTMLVVPAPTQSAQVPIVGTPQSPYREILPAQTGGTECWRFPADRQPSNCDAVPRNWTVEHR